MTPAQHYIEADRLLEEAAKLDPLFTASEIDSLVKRATAHAILATAPADSRRHFAGGTTTTTRP